MTLLQDEVIKIHSNVLSEKIIVKFTIITKNNSFMPFSTSYSGDLSLLLLHPFTITINTIYIFYTQKFSQTTNIKIKSWSHLILYYESQNIKYIEICFLHKFKTSKYQYLANSLHVLQNHTDSPFFVQILHHSPLWSWMTGYRCHLVT